MRPSRLKWRERCLGFGGNPVIELKPGGLSARGQELLAVHSLLCRAIRTFLTLPTHPSATAGRVATGERACGCRSLVSRSSNRFIPPGNSFCFCPARFPPPLSPSSVCYLSSICQLTAPLDCSPLHARLLIVLVSFFLLRSWQFELKKRCEIQRRSQESFRSVR
jgi:hypothetical protein